MSVQPVPNDSGVQRVVVGLAIAAVVFAFASLHPPDLGGLSAGSPQIETALRFVPVLLPFGLAFVAFVLVVGALGTVGSGAARLPMWRRPWVPWALITLALLMFLALAFGLLGVVQEKKVPNELSLPVLAIAGVIALLGALALVSVSLSLVGMADRTQALGLPAGSVRAVIALSLVVLFAILSVYLFSSLNAAPRLDLVASCVDETTFRQMLDGRRPSDPPMIRVPASPSPGCTMPVPGPRTGPVDAAPATRPAGPAAALPATTAPPSNAGTATTGPDATARFDVVVQRTIDPAGADFAKQLLVLIGTLVTSVASFYFGSKAVGEAREVMAGLNIIPALTGVQPPILPRGSNRPLDLLGTGLNGARQVQLSRGPYQLSAISVTSNDFRVHAEFNVPLTPVEGDETPLDVTVTDSQGRTSRLTGAVTFEKPGSSNGVTPDSKQQVGTPSTATPQPAVPAKPEDLAKIVGQLQAQKDAIDSLAAVGAGAALPRPSDGVLAELNQFLGTAAGLTRGSPDPGAIASAISAGNALLGKVQNAGLPGALADVLAVLRRTAAFAGPIVAGLPAGPFGIALGVVSSLVGLAADQQKLNAAKAALLAVPFDPGVPAPSPTRDLARVALLGTVFAAATPDQALAILQATLERRDGQPLSSDDVAASLLADPATAPLLQQFATPALRAQAIDQVRGQLLFQQEQDLLANVPPVDVPATSASPPAKLSLGALLDWLRARRGDPQASAALEKLVGIAEAVAKLPGDKQAALAQFAAALETASGLAQTSRQA